MELRRLFTITFGVQLALASLAVVAACGGEGAPAVSEGASTTSAPTTTPSPTRPAASPAADAPTASPTASGPSATASQGLPAPRVFTDRIGYIGNFRYLFKIDLIKAEVTEVGGRRTVVLRSRVTNLGDADAYLPDVKVPVLRSADGAIIATSWDTGIIPGGATTPVEITARVNGSFSFEGVSLVVGNDASHQTILPLTESARVSTFTPVFGVGKGRTATGGSLTTVKVVDGILHDDFSDGAKERYLLELKIDVSYASAAAGNYDELTFTLTAPDGTSSAPTLSYVFYTTDVAVITSGATARLGLQFRVPSTYYGEFRLTANTRFVRLNPNAGASNPVVTFEVAQATATGPSR